MFTCENDLSLFTGRGATKREGGQVQFYPTKVVVGGGGERSFTHSKVVFFFVFFSEHTQVTPGLPMLQVIYSITYLHKKSFVSVTVIHLTYLINLHIPHIDV